MRHRTLAAVGCALVVTVIAAGCAHRRAAEKPPPAAPPVVAPAPAPPSAGSPPAHPAPKGIRTGTGASKRRTPLGTLRARAIADTTAAGGMIRRCRAKKLLPEDEATLEAALQLMRQTRAAFAQKNTDLAASCARSARQLTASLGCR